MKHPVLLIVFGLIFSPAATDAAEPCGALICRSDLPVAVAEYADSVVDAGRRDAPVVFASVARIRASVPELDLAKRGPFAIVGPGLRGIDGDILPALLERIALSDSGPALASPSARKAWQIGLLDALGKLRDQRSAAILETVCRRSQADREVLTAAAAALGRLESDGAASALVELSCLPGQRGQAVLAGMGHCRRLVVVRRLAEALTEQTDPSAHRRVARSLATAASAPVWHAGLVQHPEEGPAIRDLAAQALFDDFVARSPAERKAVFAALLVVDHHASMDRLKAAALRADADLAEDLDHLARLINTNPVSTMKTPER